MFVDEITIHAKAGDGGDGVVRWLHLKYQPKAGPAGGNGGRGGDVFVRGVRNVNTLAKYRGKHKFIAQNGEEGRSQSQHGRAGEDLYIDVPVGSKIAVVDKGREFQIDTDGQIEKVLLGGRGGLGNEQFKSSTNTTPQESTAGTVGEEGELKIEVALIADVGLVGVPNAGKSTLLNLLTNAQSVVGNYPFTTLEPHLGDLRGFIIADIPGLISGASEGKGLGFKFLRHISKTKMLLHLVALDSEDPVSTYLQVRKEVETYKNSIDTKEEWIILTKNDLISQDILESIKNKFDKTKKRVFVISENDENSIKTLRQELLQHLSE